VKRLGRESFQYAFDPALAPALEVEPGESFWVETHDAHRGTVTDESVVYSSLDEVLERLGGANPVTGPIAVRGASPGDCLIVSIEQIVAAPRRRAGYTCTTPRVEPSLTPETVICRIAGDEVVLPTAAGDVRLPLQPMIGTLGVAPAGEPRSSFEQGRDILGNVDLPALTAGARVVVRAQVAGGLLSLGDAHLAQGDAEIHRAAIEAEADVRLVVELASPEEVGYVELPQLDTEESWGCIAPGPGHLEELVRAAYDDLAQRLVARLGVGRADAYRLLGSAGRITVGQVVPPLSSVLAWIPIKLLSAFELGRSNGRSGAGVGPTEPRVRSAGRRR
jgi:amidase